MSISVTWDNQAKTIIRYDFAGKWNWYGYEMAVGEAFGMMESVSHPVDFIFNMQNSQPLPEGATFYLKRTLELSPSGQSVIVIAHADKSAQATVSLFRRIYKKMEKRLLIAPSVDKARTVLTEPAAPTPAGKTGVIRLIAAG